MFFLRPSMIAGFILGVCFSAAYADSGVLSHAAYATPVCPPGADPQNCLDNAYRAIDNLERRVSMLETGRRAASYAASAVQTLVNTTSTAPSESNADTATNGISGLLHHPDCLPGSAWDGVSCAHREGE